MACEGRFELNCEPALVTSEGRPPVSGLPLASIQRLPLASVDAEPVLFQATLRGQGLEALVAGHSGTFGMF